MTARYDWDYFRHRYVTGDDAVTLDFLSSQPNAPSLHRLKIKSSEQTWTEQRKQFRNQAATITAQGAVAQEAIQQTQKLVDAAEVIARHLKLARALQTVGATALQKELITAEDLNPRDVLAWITQGIQIERLACDMATSKTDISVDFSKLSDEQLERIAQGEDINKVVAA